MSLLKLSDYLNQSKETKARERIKKTKLPTQNKTKKHKCSQCPRLDANLYPIGEKEKRWLCPDCIRKNQNRDVKEKPNFVRASKLA